MTPISILACGGNLPLEIAQMLQRDGRPVNVVCIAGMADADYAGFPLTVISIGRIGALLAALRAGGASEMLIAGHARRPDLRGIKIDGGFMRHILTILSLMRGGDDHVLRKIAGFFERNGLTVKSIAEVVPELLTPCGVMAGGQQTAPANRGAELGLELVRSLGRFDVGQAVVVEGNRVIAIEGAEGTNGLLTRLPCSEARGSGADRGARILVKAAKPEQDLRVDLPTIGPETIDRCVIAGVGTIALEAGRSLIVSRHATIERARSKGITLIGLSPPEPLSTDGGRAPAPRPLQPRLASLARAHPGRQALRDAAKGMQLLMAIDAGIMARAAIVVRENVLAINVNEPMQNFMARNEQLLQWGDRRQKGKRNRTLVLATPADVVPELVQVLITSKIAGLAFLSIGHETENIDQLVEAANSHNLFVLSAK